jgi:sugar/nucleoside kinase (ribokinase family)
LGEAVFDVVGVGLNATDTLILLPHFPAYGGKVPFTQEVLSPGGQVASAVVCCAELGLRTSYIGAIGDDERGRIQWESLQGLGIHLGNVCRRANTPNQSAYILIDQRTGERTVLWNRPEALKMEPGELREEMIANAALLHIDGHDTALVAEAARIARRHSIPVTVDVDTIYEGFDAVLPNVDYLIASSEFPERWTGVADPLAALARIQDTHGMRCAAMTLGAHGALARVDGRYYYSPGFVVSCVDTTGAGDIFHGAFCYAVVKGMELTAALAFSNAMAALNCTAMGARGGIATAEAAQTLIEHGERRLDPRFLDYRC